MFYYAVSTDKDFETVAGDLEKVLAEYQFNVLFKFDVGDKIRQKGFGFSKQIMIFEVCNAGKAKEVLESNILAGYFLPCKVVVYVEKGKTRIGMLKPTVLMEVLGKDRQLNEQAINVENILIKVLDKISQN
ncbi:MAG: DUF302 domain-containing protein [Eubacteriales bacterium]